VSSRERRVVAADLLYVDVALRLDQQLGRRVAVGDCRQAGDVLEHRLIVYSHLQPRSPTACLTALSNALGSQMYTVKLEAAGQCIPTPRHVCRGCLSRVGDVITS